jgi:hypothetical protein
MHEIRQSLSAEAPTHAADEHWLANDPWKKGQPEAVQEFARKASAHSIVAIILSEKAFRQELAALGEAARELEEAAWLRRPIAKRDSKNATATALHTNAACEDCVARYRLRRGDESLTGDHARSAFERSREAAILSFEAWQDETSDEAVEAWQEATSNEETLSMAAD